MTMNHKEALRIACEAYDNTATHFYGTEAAIRAYIEARGLALVPKEATQDMLWARDWRLSTEGNWKLMLAAAPDPFSTDGSKFASALEAKEAKP